MAALNNIGQAGGLLGMGAGIAAIASSAAAGTAFVMAVGGPQVAVTAGVLGLALMLREAYSNREKQHEKLIPYVWSLIDDEPPKINIHASGQSGHLDMAANHAIYLMKEADAQFEGMGRKLSLAEGKFEKFMDSYGVAIDLLIRNDPGKNKWIGAVKMEGWTAERKKAPPAQQGFYDHHVLEALESFNQAKINSEKMWAEACKQGNPIFEFMRRLSHVGNYFQCAQIINVATYTKLGSSTRWNTTDPLLQWTGTTYYRERLKKISEMKKLAEDNYAEYELFVQRNGIHY
ncbi:hypothetical protein [Rhodoferax saidenbachensis]|uniref:Uncharacterized protein n=1 Tax=Rhodoferax saidenbachensis TaxID=1484693 RepID=A0A1P8KC76_9BURK|nr:hypothetical protein [Rhodoferax saidenbachensis]APW43614.1 hypothetical protein RS694_14450 [Rhodoferax saidenbachensis]